MKHLKIAAALLLLTTLAGCGPVPDQELRRQLFKECLSVVPKGPERTVYNDWDEVVSECGRQAYSMSLQLGK